MRVIYERTRARRQRYKQCFVIVCIDHIDALFAYNPTQRKRQ
jgi:hypothetical protein